MTLALRPYQQFGVNFLIGSTSALLADEMGLGKTPQTLVAIAELYARSKTFSRALIIAPAGLLTNWLREAQIFAPDVLAGLIVGDQQERLVHYRLPIPIQIASYDSVRDDAHLLMRRYPFDLVVLDEAQRIKNINSRTSLACRSLPRSASWALTGTPIENSVLDLAAIFSFVRPGLFSYIPSSANAYESIAPYFLRRRVKDVLAELPAVLISTKYITLDAEQRRLYDIVAADSRDQSLVAPIATVLAQITRLKQLCNFEPISGTSSKVEVLKTIIEEGRQSGKKVLVFSQFVETLKFIRSKIGVPSGLYEGSLTATERDDMIDNFKASPDAEVLLMSLKAGAVGLNLQEAEIVVIFDRWWNPAVEQQAIGRAKRFGRTTPLTVYLFEAVDTIEERIVAVLDQKQQLFDDYIDAASDDVPPIHELRALLRNA